MIAPSDAEFDQLITKALASLPNKYTSKLQNVAILYEGEPSSEQRQQLQLRGDQTLLGLYEGVPLPARSGTTKLLPDKITLFKLPLTAHSNTTAELAENIRHTLWHEMAHFFGLDHKRIHELE